MEPRNAASATGPRGIRPRDLAAVLLVLLGVWTLVDDVLVWGEWLRSDAPLPRLMTVGRSPWTTWILALGPAIGVGLVFGGRRLAAFLFRDPGPPSPPVECVALVAAGLAVIGVLVLFDQADALVQVLLRVLDRFPSGAVPTRELLAAVLTGGVGIALSARSGAIARRWGRWNGIG